MKSSALIHRLMLLLAVAVFLVGGWRQTEAIGTWHEELSAFPRATFATFDLSEDQKELHYQVYCGPGSGGRWSWSRSRPRLTVCAGEHVYPVMVDSYFSGLFNWPSQLLQPVHRGDPFSLRKVGVVLGALGLLLGYAFVARLRDEKTAAIVVLVTSVSSSFVTLHGLLVSYETLPWYFVVGALMALGPRPTEASPRRVWLASGLAGIAIIANVKALFLLGPIVALALWHDPRIVRSFRRREAGVAACIFAAATSPMWLSALLDPGGGFGGQIMWRSETIVRKLSTIDLWGEFRNLLVFGSDVGMMLTEERKPALHGLVIVGASVVWSWFHLGQWILRRRGNLLGALCGGLFLAFFFVSMLLYDQEPPANYSPLFAVFGMALGGLLASLVERVPPGGRWRDVAAVVLVGAVMVSGAHVLSHRAETLRAVGGPLSVDAQFELAEYLKSSDRTPRFMTLTYVTTGLPEVLAPETGVVIRGHLVVEGCLRNASSETEAGQCVEDRMGRMLAMLEGDAVELLVPIGDAVVDPRYTGTLGRVVRRVEGWTWRVAHTCHARSGQPVFEVLRGDRVLSDPVRGSAARAPSGGTR